MTNREWLEKMSNKQLANRLQKLMRCKDCPVKNCIGARSVGECKSFLQKWLESEAE